MNTIFHGDCLDELKKLEDNSVDLLCTDPPYGYSFMGKDWDKAVPSVEIWKECLRVLKPGAFAFVMSAPRQDVLSQMIVRIGEAGFDTDYTSIYWTYASGFPKAMNIGKMVDKRAGAEREITGMKLGGERLLNQTKDGIRIGDNGWKETGRTPYTTAPATDAAQALDGSYGGFQPKPAVEVIIVAMKPLSEKTFVDQALKNGKGITWLDDCRIPTTENLNGGAYSGNERGDGEWKDGSGFKNDKLDEYNQPTGRFPANLLCSDDVLNDGRVIKAGGSRTKAHGATGQVFVHGGEHTSFKDEGSYSRYFNLDAWAKTLPFLITPKASKREKNEGLDDFGSVTVGDGRKKAIDNAFQRGKTERVNSHPTVKPLKLMAYLITLGSRPGDTVLEPFAGSGTTCLAAKNLGRNYIGIEKEEEYVKIARARLENAAPVQPTLIAAE
jgi:site-specific DNA-methyltransferase (adenine-specific)